MVNASTWALMLTGRLLDDDPGKPAAALRRLIRRVGEPVVRNAVAQSMRLLGRQFVLGQTIEECMRNAREREREGYTYSYDMLGDAARTEADALRYIWTPTAARSPPWQRTPRGTCGRTRASRSSCRRCIRATSTPIARR
jgi:proline dehydrogenase